HPHVMAKILTAELRAYPKRLRKFMYFLFQFEIPKSVPRFRSMRRQGIQITTGGELQGFHRQLGRGAADYNRQVVGRTGSRTEGEHLLLQKGQQTVMCENGRGSLEQKWLVCRASAFGDE